MSLVNDVLRQLDTASSKPYQAMPLHTFMVDEPASNNKLVSILFIVLVTILLIALSLQLFYKKSLIDFFYVDDQKVLALPEHALSLIAPQIASKNSKEILQILENDRAMNDYSVREKIRLDSALVSEPDMLKGNGMAMKNEIKSESQVPENKINKEGQSEINNIVAISSIPSKKNSSKKTPSKKEELEKKVLINTVLNKKNIHQSANIQPVENVGFKQYQLALRAYKQKQSLTALSWINLAIKEEKKEEYLRLKVRVLMQKGDGVAVQRFVLEQRDNTSLTWFELIAPSLQMYSYYELSNKYYAELVKQQPNEVKWQLAMALNLSKLGLDQETYSIYKNLLKSSLLTYKQQKWIASRLERMTQNEVVINER